MNKNTQIILNFLIEEKCNSIYLKINEDNNYRMVMEYDDKTVIMCPVKHAKHMSQRHCQVWNAMLSNVIQMVLQMNPRIPLNLDWNKRETWDIYGPRPDQIEACSKFIRLG